MTRVGTALLVIALIVAACGGAGPTPITVYVTPEPTVAVASSSPVPTRSPSPEPSTASHTAACAAAYDAVSVIASEAQTMIEAYVAGDAATMLAQAGRVSLMAEQSVDALPDGYRDLTALRLFAERMAVVQTLTTLEGGLLDAGPFSEAMIELIDVSPALAACAP